MIRKKLTFDDYVPGSRKHPISILADNITLTKNIGSLFRLCDALGIEYLYLASQSTTLDSKFSKVSRFSERNVPYSFEQDPQQKIRQLKKNGYTIISLELTSDSTNIRDFDFSRTEKLCLILGNEAKGISDDLLAVSDHCVHIPMLGMNSSMNVICAASIAIYEMSRHLS
ncbi:MAG: TrmH family RNA methyltransferase [Gammaproteobacteria bacterium]|nr:TrmH family RNA methyltransferase [Gammaproteobacteria bacterium]